MAKLPPVGKVVGIDMGVKDVAVTSGGLKTGNPKYTEKYAYRLRQEQKSLGRKKKGSKNREKQKRKVARIYSKARNSRRDFLHKFSTDMVRKNQTVCIENLNAKGMVKNRRLAKSIADGSWGTLALMLEYKCAWYGRDFVKVPPMHTSQDCSECGFRNKGLELKDRRWKCPGCGTDHDRDVNAARNILAVGTTVTACGDGVRPKVLVPEAVVCEARISAL